MLFPAVIRGYSTGRIYTLKTQWTDAGATYQTIVNGFVYEHIFVEDNFKEEIRKGKVIKAVLYAVDLSVVVDAVSKAVSHAGG